MARKELLRELSKTRCSLLELERVIIGESIQPTNVLVCDYKDSNGNTNKTPLYEIMTTKTNDRLPLELEAFYFDLKNKIVISRRYKICFKNGGSYEKNLDIKAPAGYDFEHGLESLSSYIPGDQLGEKMTAGDIVNILVAHNTQYSSIKNKSKNK